VKAGKVSIQQHFPQYDSWFGKMVGQFLNGDFGPSIRLTRTSPRSFTRETDSNSSRASNLLCRAAKLSLVDRYIGSNLAHQTARVAPEKRAEFRRWIEHLEYGIYDLPREDLILYLRVPPARSARLVAKKSARVYTTAKQDILEASLRHLEQAADMYDLLALEAPWGNHRVFRRGPRCDALAQRNRPRRASSVRK